MSTVNASTGFSPFQLHLGRSPRLIPPLLPLVSETPPSTEDDVCAALRTIHSLQNDIADAHDSLFASKASQASAANTHRLPDPEFKLDDLVYLSTKHRRREYMQHGSKRVAK
ncbi:hypothetical protein CONPUDRAFT_28202, partial [Coniophora puteana RWD-64-598 SS2]